MNIYEVILDEKAKESPDYGQEMADYIIGALVQDRTDLNMAYDIYNGKIDKSQYAYLEDNFGIGTPTNIEFIPLVRRHVDYLVGKYLQSILKPKVTCKDEDTISEIMKQKEQEVFNKEIEMLKEQLKKNISYAIGETNIRTSEEVFEKELSKAKEDIESGFVSLYEQSVQTILKMFENNKEVDLLNKRRKMYLDLLIAGQCYFNVYTRKEGETPIIEVLDTRNFFYEENPESDYAKDAPFAVYRRRMNPQQAIYRYGSMLSEEDIQTFTSSLFHDSPNSYIMTAKPGQMFPVGIAIPDSAESDQYGDNYIDVYECQWIACNKDGDDYRQDRYSCIKIGDNTYIYNGKDKDVCRSQEYPNKCGLTFNGMRYLDKKGSASSLVMSTAVLQMKYNILHFYRDELIANSGTKGNIICLPMIPKFMGKTPQERLIAYQAYHKQGMSIIDPSQEGASTESGGALNTIFNGYDDTVSLDSLNAIHSAITQVEEVCSSITGVGREALGDIEQRDAVSNVKVGIKQSSIITKQYYHIMDLVTDSLLVDMVNNAKASYRNGKVGMITLGDRMNRVFTIDPKYFSFTDYDIHIADSDEILEDMQKIEAYTMKLIESGQVDFDVVLEGVTSQSLCEMKNTVLNAFKKKKQENNQLQKAQEQIQQFDDQIKQLSTERDQMAKQLEALNKKAGEIEAKKMELDYEVKKEANAIKRIDVDNNARLKERQVQAEVLQLYDGNNANDEITNV